MFTDDALVMPKTQSLDPGAAFFVLFSSGCAQILRGSLRVPCSGMLIKRYIYSSFRPAAWFRYRYHSGIA